MSKVISLLVVLCTLCLRAEDVAFVRASEFAGEDGGILTEALQEALDSGARRVYIDRRPGGWTTGPLMLRRSGLEVVLSDGVTLKADPARFASGRDDLFLCTAGVSNVIVRGEGKAAVDMGGCGRHAFNFTDAARVAVCDLEIVGAGFDALHFVAVRGFELSGVTCRGAGGNGLFVDGTGTDGSPVAARYTLSGCEFVGSGVRPVCLRNLVPADTVFKFSRCRFDARDVPNAAISLGITHIGWNLGGIDFGDSHALVDKGAVWEFDGTPGAGLEKFAGWLYEDRPRHSRLLTGSGMARTRPPDPEEAVALPGEDDPVPPLPPDPFPDRMSAYVWRNWGLVPTARLAETIRATEADLEQIAVEMGLPAKPEVLPEWKSVGYITIVRRNWHLLDYPQLLRLLGFTRREFRSILLEHDTLYMKLGKVKPACAPLMWSVADAAVTRDTAPDRRRLAAILAEEGIDPAAPEEPRFEFKRRYLAPVAGGAETGTRKSGSPFDLRMIFSYFADYGDPLMDPEIASYPEGLLDSYRKNGVNAVWLHVPLYMLTTDPKYPEFGVGAAQRIANLKKLVARAAKYGIKVFFYMNEPRVRPNDFFAASPERMAMKGVSNAQGSAMCISHPETQRWLKSAMRQLFTSVPGLGGIFTISASENLTTCAAHGRTRECDKCRDRDPADVVAEANRLMIEGMLEGNPDAEAVVWDWRWDTFIPPSEPGDSPVLRRLPRDPHVRFMTMSERSVPLRRAGIDYAVNEYTVSVAGPGPRPKELWRLARSLGFRVGAKVQTSLSWEFAVAPYLPTMDIVAEHAWNLMKEGVDGVLMSWSLGGAPSPNMRIYDEIRRDDASWSDVLDRIAADTYGREAAPLARKGWTAFSKGFAEYPFEVRLIRNAPHHWGPANPLYLKPTRLLSTMTGIPYDAVYDWLNETYTPELYAAQMDKVAAGFAEGCGIWEEMAGRTSGEVRDLVRRELGVFRAEQLTFASCADQTRFILARDRGDRAEMARMARRELETAKAFLPLVRADSSIGFESSNHYFYLPRDVIEKILCCRQILSTVK